MESGYSSILIFFVIGFSFALVTLGINNLIGPNRNRGIAQKFDVYECGEVVEQEALVNFNIRYYVFALTFFVFDMEAIFLYPWAIVFTKMGLFGLMSMILFLVVLGVGLLYAFKKDVLKWV